MKIKMWQNKKADLLENIYSCEVKEAYNDKNIGACDVGNKFAFTSRKLGRNALTCESTTNQVDKQDIMSYLDNII